MYRAGYGTKDKRQACILAIRMKHANFEVLLRQATVTGHSGRLTPEEAKKPVRVQWDPERNFKLEMLPYRSIQIGIGGMISQMWADRYIESIEDVTEKAHELMKYLEEIPNIRVEELMRLGLVPEEKPYEVSEELKELLKMNSSPSG